MRPVYKKKKKRKRDFSVIFHVCPAAKRFSAWMTAFDVNKVSYLFFLKRNSSVFFFLNLK